ncbi:hypothetical protein [Phenylobacterium sp.]|uniref:hypothetical protein n=1 Tax=Phenylobacterium sp. TaxID=1871053 RepID=UPI001229DEE5|nr:hypothetical protein [Phenylobacterium sp.]THD57742.1 MAG: hypothetical protein E8A49_21275 [Phenylobacterium sp.]
MRIAWLGLLVSVAAGPCAWAQAGASEPQPPTQAPPPTAGSPDVIGALIDQHGRAPGDEDEPDVAGQTRGTQADSEPRFTPPRPGAPVIPFPPPPRPQTDAPVALDDLARTPDGPMAIRDLAYDSRIRSSFASAQSFQGPLDGGWTLSGAGQDLYILQLVDRRDRLEGVWRDPRRRGARDASGLVDDLERQGGALTLRFVPQPGAPTVVATLRDNGGGVWTGELTEAGARRSVVLRRTSP